MYLHKHRLANSLADLADSLEHLDWNFGCRFWWYGKLYVFWHFPPSLIICFLRVSWPDLIISITLVVESEFAFHLTRIPCSLDQNTGTFTYKCQCGSHYHTHLLLISIFSKSTFLWWQYCCASIFSSFTGHWNNHALFWFFVLLANPIIYTIASCIMRIFLFSKTISNSNKR